MTVQDTDLEATADEAQLETSLGNPLRDALDRMRSGRDEPTGQQDEDETLDDEPAEEVDVEEEEVGDETDAQADDAEDEAEEPAEDEESESPKKTPKLSSIEIPMPNADGSKGPRGTGKVTLEGVPQQAADALRHYMKQADKVPLLEEQLQVASESAQIADFVERDPFSAMVMMNNAVPAKVDEFVKVWMQMNPNRITEFVTELELEDLTSREATLGASQAKRDAHDRANQSLNNHNGQFQHQRTADRLLVTAQNLGRTAGVEKDEMDEYMFVASRRIAKLYQNNPNITERDVVAGLQSVVAKYAKAPAPAPKAKLNADPAKTFKARVGKSQKFTVIGSGKQPLKAAGATTKVPKGTTTQQAIRMIREGKI